MSVGLRVIRGPDWSSGECDGGEGHLGTVVEVDKQGTVDVIWDNGQRRTCQAGKGGKCELRIIDNATVGSRHTAFNCNECGERGIFGMRWACKSCNDVHLCPICYVQDKHKLNHEFKRYDYPGVEGVDVKKRAASQRIQAMGIFPSAMVVRGDDWQWDQQDGGSGSKGTVVSIGRAESGSSARSVVNVRWEKDDRTKLYQYRVGHDGKMDLKFVEESPGIYYYKDHLPNLDVTKTMKSSANLQTLQVGDQVCIHLDENELKRVQADSGGWTAAMANCIEKLGTVKGFTGGGDILVGYDLHNFRLYPGALSKVPSISVGDVVKVISDEKKVRVLQQSHSGWNDDISQLLGKVGKVVKKDDAGNVVVAFGQAVLVLNPACCVPAPGAAVFNAGSSMESFTVEEGPSGNHEALLQILGALLAMGSGEEKDVTIDALYQAIAQNNVHGVRSILGKKRALLQQSHKGVTPLILASHEGQTEMVKMMLDSGADLEMQDHKGNTALIAALIGKKEVVAKLLIDRGADVTVTNKGRQTCVHVAAWANLSSILPLIIKKGGDINSQDGAGDTPLHDAIQKGSQDCIKILLEQKTINLKTPNGNGMMALHFAALRDRVAAVELILQRDKSLVKVLRMNKDYVPLHIAAANDHIEIARLLIDMGGCPVDIIGSNGRTPLHIAAIEAHIRVIELLIRKGAQLDLKDNDGNSALHMALGAKRSVESGEMSRGEVEARIRVACYLMECNATYNQKNDDGRTPLEKAKNDDIRRAMTIYIEDHKQNLKARPVTAKPGQGHRGRKVSQDDTQFSIRLPCCSCFSQMSDVTLKPCGHKVLCRSCCVRAQICPMCQTAIEHRETDDQVDVEEVCKVQ